MPTPYRAAAAAFASRVTESDLPVLRRLNASQRRDFALDLCALLDFATPGGEPVSGSPPPNAGGLRAAVMIDHVPGMTSRAACALVDRLSLASRRSVPDVRNLRVFEVHDVVIIAHAPRLRDELLGWRGSASTRRRRLVDVLPAAEPAMRAALVADARGAPLARSRAREAREARRRGKRGGKRRRARRTKTSRPRDLVAALGALADAVPPPTLVGACLGYPRVYSWSKAGDVAAAARALSSETLRVYAVYARFRGVEKNGTRKRAYAAATRRVCGFTVPAREAWEEGEGSRNEASPSSESRSNRIEAEDEDEAVTSVDGDARAWLEAMRERAAAGGDVWTDLELRVETRGAGPVAL